MDSINRQHREEKRKPQACLLCGCSGRNSRPPTVSNILGYILWDGDDSARCVWSVCTCVWVYRRSPITRQDGRPFDTEILAEWLHFRASQVAPAAQPQQAPHLLSSEPRLTSSRYAPPGGMDATPDQCLVSNSEPFLQVNLLVELSMSVDEPALPMRFLGSLHVGACCLDSPSIASLDYFVKSDMLNPLL